MDRYPEGEEEANSEDCFDEDDFDEFGDLVGYGNRDAADFMINIPLINIINSNYQQLKNNKEVNNFMLE
jgi:hypothetical protein